MMKMSNGASRTAKRLIIILSTMRLWMNEIHALLGGIRRVAMMKEMKIRSFRPMAKFTTTGRKEKKTIARVLVKIHSLSEE